MYNQQPQNQEPNNSPYNRPFIMNEPVNQGGYTAPSFNGDWYEAELKRKQHKAEIRRIGNAIGGAFLLFDVATFVISYFIRFVLDILGDIGFSGYDAMMKFLASPDGDSLLTPIVYLGTLTFLMIPALMKKKTSSLIDFGKFSIKKAVYSIMAGLGICILGNIASAFISAFLSNFGITTKGGDYEIGSSPYSFLLSTLSIAVVPALMEEFAARGCVIGSLREKFNPLPTIFISGALFGLWHGNLNQIPFAFFGGVAFGFMYYYTGSIWPSIILHFLNNFMSVSLSFGTRDMSTVASNMITWLIFASLILVGMILYISILSFSLERK